nr:PREDICTED: 26S protease regulatory subunit 6B [Struthio camelus australis]
MVWKVGSPWPQRCPYGLKKCPVVRGGVPTASGRFPWPRRCHRGLREHPVASGTVPCPRGAPRAPHDAAAVAPQKLQQELEFLEVQEEYIKDEQKNLKKEFLHAQEEVKRIQSIPLVIGQFLEAVDQNTAIVGSTTGSNYYVRILSTIDRELLKPNASVALHKHSNALVDVLPPEADSSIMMLTSDQKPDVMYADIGGMDIQKQEVREAVELPLTHFELYKQIGIDPPRGVLMYGPPGCGKTMLAKAVAHHTTAAFLPDREVQRILLELLNQMDGFDQNVNVKVVVVTKQVDIPDPRVSPNAKRSHGCCGGPMGAMPQVIMVAT